MKRRATELAARLRASGSIHMTGPFVDHDDAWRAARDVVDSAETDLPLEVIGDFLLPPADGPPSRDFQTLHFDFGLPLVPVVPADVARFTALHVALDVPPTDAVTRLVHLGPLLANRCWPPRSELVRRFTTYGKTHGTRDDTAGYVEGSLARVAEAAIGRPPTLPSLKEQPEFLCGTEFASLADEHEFFAKCRLPLATATIEVCVRSGEMLLFDNLVLAHGRRGVRRPGELNQRVFGHRDLAVPQQLELRDCVLAAFSTPADKQSGAPRLL